MADTTANLKLPYIMFEQAQKHITHNEALRRLDAIVQLSAASRGRTTPPDDPAEGARYLVAAGADGAWSGQTDAIAAWQDGVWTFYVPMAGWRVWIEDERSDVFWDGAAWQSRSLGLDLVGIHATPDATNRLAVGSPASLFTNEGAGHRMKINKAAAGDTGSLVFQTGWSGRAEIGLCGDDDFHFKVSPDGTTWREAIGIDRATGEPVFPFSTAIARPNIVINGDFSINQRAFAGGTLEAGAYGFDRWKADAGGAHLSVSGRVATLAAGAIVQVVEPATGGLESFAARRVTVSAESPSAALAVSFGSASGTIAAGSGRRSTSFTLGAGDTGNLSLWIAAADGGSVSFGQVKLETGNTATAWTARPAASEMALCKWYFQILTSVSHLIAYSTSNVTAVVNWTDRMRAGPVMRPQGPLMLVRPGINSYLQASAEISGASTTVDGAKFDLPNFTGLTSGASYLSYFTENGQFVELSAEL